MVIINDMKKAWNIYNTNVIFNIQSIKHSPPKALSPEYNSPHVHTDST